MTRFLSALCCAFLVAALANARPVALAQSSGERLHLSAVAINLDRPAGVKTQPIEIDIDSFTPAADRNGLIGVAVDGGQDKLLDALRDQPKRGRMWSPGWQGPDPLNARLGWDLRYAFQTRTDEGGRRIVLATDRPIGFWEARNQSRTLDYPFTLIQIEVDREGRGEGKMSVATRIRFDKKDNALELENWGLQPARLTQVKLTTR